MVFIIPCCQCKQCFVTDTDSFKRYIKKILIAITTNLCVRQVTFARCVQADKACVVENSDMLRAAWFAYDIVIVTRP